jgi:hypothetical protein
VIPSTYDLHMPASTGSLRSLSSFPSERLYMQQFLNTQISVLKTIIPTMSFLFNANLSLFNIAISTAGGMNE